MDPYNATTLDAELKAAGLKISGCSSQGQIDWLKPPTTAEQKKADGVLKQHDPKKLAPRDALLESLRAKRRAGKALTSQEQQDLLDHLLGV